LNISPLFFEFSSYGIKTKKRKLQKRSFEISSGSSMLISVLFVGEKEEK
jgi:hypothetical protein